MEALKDYQKMEQSQGREYDMSPASIKHIAIQRNLSAIIWNFLRGKRCKLFTEAEVVFDDENIFIPDLLVVCDQNQIKKNCIDGAPDFVVEVLSPSTKRRDVTIKKEVYEKFGVKEYWIINPADESIETYILKNNKFILDNIYHNFDEEDWAALTEAEKAEQQLSLKISMYPDLEIVVKDVFAT